MSTKSVFFCEMFAESDDKEITITDTTYEAFETMVGFIYTNKLVLKDDKDFDLIFKVCELSRKYQLLDLIQSIEIYFKTRLCFGNLETVCRYAFHNDNAELIDLIKAFLDINYDDIAEKSKEEYDSINQITRDLLNHVSQKRFKYF